MFTLFVLISLTFFSNTEAGVSFNYYWRDYIPGNSLYDAYEAIQGRYIGQVHAAESLLPGTLYPFNNSAIALGYNGQRIVALLNIKILCVPNPEWFYWEHVNFEQPHIDQLANVVKGGFQIESPLYIGRVIDNKEWKIGQVFPRDHKYSGLWVWNLIGRSARYYQFDILKYNSSAIFNGNCFK